MKKLLLDAKYDHFVGGFLTTTVKAVEIQYQEYISQ